jgi:hypothetical protein
VSYFCCATEGHSVRNAPPTIRRDLQRTVGGANFLDRRKEEGKKKKRRRQKEEKKKAKRRKEEGKKKKRRRQKEEVSDLP